MKQGVSKEVSRSANCGDDVLVYRLLPEEYDVYVWLLQAYSLNWISETLGLDKRTVKILVGNVYKTLEVRDQRELVRYYFSSEKFVANANSKPLHGEELAYSMACYTNQCVEANIIFNK